MLFSTWESQSSRSSFSMTKVGKHINMLTIQNFPKFRQNIALAMSICRTTTQTILPDRKRNENQSDKNSRILRFLDNTSYKIFLTHLKFTLKHAYPLKIAHPQTYVQQGYKNDKIAIKTVIAGENILGSLCIKKGLFTLFPLVITFCSIPNLY